MKLMRHEQDLNESRVRSVIVQLPCLDWQSISDPIVKIVSLLACQRQQNGHQTDIPNHR